MYGRVRKGLGGGGGGGEGREEKAGEKVRRERNRESSGWQIYGRVREEGRKGKCMAERKGRRRGEEWNEMESRRYGGG